MVFGMISANGTGLLVWLERRVSVQEISAKTYDTNYNQELCIQRQRSVLHCQMMKSFLGQEKVTVRNCPNLNPIQNVRKLLEKRTKARNHGHFQELLTALRDERVKTTLKERSHLMKSSSRRFQVVVDKKQYCTKY